MKQPPSLTCPPRFSTARNPARRTLGPLVGEIAKAMGKPFMPWQQHVIDIALEVDDDGNLYYGEVVLTVPRQSGKTTLLLALILHRAIANYPGGNLQQGPQRQVVAYGAQTRNDAREKWVEEWIPEVASTDLTRYILSTRLTNGSEHWKFRNGSLFRLFASTEKAGHGPTVDLGILDEAFAQVDNRVEVALEPSTATRRSPQFWVVSTVGENRTKHPYFHAKTLAGRRSCTGKRQAQTNSHDQRVAYFEWSCPEDQAHDLEAIIRHHPAVGHSITADFIRRKYAKAIEEEKLPEFFRSYANVWGSINEHPDAHLPADQWAASRVSAEQSAILVARRPLAFAFAVEPAGASAHIVAATGTITEPYLELVPAGTDTPWLAGIDWLPARLVDLIETHGPHRVGFVSSGPTAAQIPAVMEALKAADIDLEILDPVMPGRYRAACEAFDVDIRAGRLKRRIGQDLLDDSGAKAVARKTSEGWSWDRDRSPVPTAPLEAATIARWLLPELAEPEPEEEPLVFCY